MSWKFQPRSLRTFSSPCHHNTNAEVELWTNPQLPKPLFACCSLCEGRAGDTGGSAERGTCPQPGSSVRLSPRSSSGPAPAATMSSSPRHSLLTEPQYISLLCKKSSGFSSMKISLGVSESFPFHQLKGELAARDGDNPEGVLSPENTSESGAGLHIKTTALRRNSAVGPQANQHRSLSATGEIHTDLTHTALKSLEKPFHSHRKRPCLFLSPGRWFGEANICTSPMALR